MMKPTCPPIRSLMLAGLLLLAAAGAEANNIEITTQPTLTGNTGTTVQVQFGLSWENSWRTSSAPANWDAAWVFVKYRDAAGVWRHANLNSTGHVAPGGSQIDVGLLIPGTAFNASTNPAVGAFIYRNANGTGTFSLTNVQLQWNYAATGITYANIAQVQVHAIEMVYVPQGSFWVGSGGTETGSFTNGSWTSGATIPLQITSEAVLTIAQSTGNLWGTSSTGDNSIGPAGSLAATYPKGFAAFYCMKYEVTQQGYVDFLNTLTYTQQATRTATAPNNAAGSGALSSTNANRNGIDIQTPGVASTTPALYACNLDGDGVYSEAASDGTDLAVNWISWADLSAYLDWCGLRPMTELEYEKACRGIAVPVANEYTWGTATIASAAYTFSNSGATNEGVATNYSTTVGNAYYFTTGSSAGPARVGIFAANAANTGRVSSGASYYGIMELGGNVWEKTVTVGNAQGRAFTGAHGDGALPTSGDPDVTNWPAPGTASGAGLRGGGGAGVNATVQIGWRIFAGTVVSIRESRAGGRGVRTQ